MDKKGYPMTTKPSTESEVELPPCEPTKEQKKQAQRNIKAFFNGSYNDCLELEAARIWYIATLKAALRDKRAAEQERDDLKAKVAEMTEALRECAEENDQAWDEANKKGHALADANQRADEAFNAIPIMRVSEMTLRMKATMGDRIAQELQQWRKWAKERPTGKAVESPESAHRRGWQSGYNQAVFDVGQGEETPYPGYVPPQEKAGE